MLIPVEANSVAKMPPPACANAEPYERGSELVTVHPGPPVELSQLVEFTNGEFATLQPFSAPLVSLEAMLFPR